ncbi:hypothetical protein T265_03744 [Opisthorchis viverrini]|uniref:Uncharacterized protein n=1 Tax=Opisthorchis viverrini TaxID=6198 RepID=A0A075A2H7_OPIVI|nr:hypothetical protein T265_03744 [Opisthorchis viverrini]KER29730.1 hypothetical protein T265_03744 [Opisthorchis viverrini]
MTMSVGSGTQGLDGWMDRWRGAAEQQQQWAGCAREYVHGNGDSRMKIWSTNKNKQSTGTVLSGGDDTSGIGDEEHTEEPE